MSECVWAGCCLYDMDVLYDFSPEERVLATAHALTSHVTLNPSTVPPTDVL